MPNPNLCSSQALLSTECCNFPISETQPQTTADQGSSEAVGRVSSVYFYLLKSYLNVLKIHLVRASETTQGPHVTPDDTFFTYVFISLLTSPWSSKIRREISLNSWECLKKSGDVLPAPPLTGPLGILAVLTESKGRQFTTSANFHLLQTILSIWPQVAW